MSHAHPTSVLHSDDSADFMKHTLEAVSNGLAAGFEPLLTNDGTSGTYIMRD
jgi:hypothetical protein